MTAKISPYITEYQRGELIFSPSDKGGRVGFVVEGECEVLRDRSGENKVILNILKENDSFGVLSIFGDALFPTYVYSRKKCRICYISEEDTRRLIELSPRVAVNVIEFLANRVGFLNSRIETVTMTTVESKLASYLINKSETMDCLSFPFNMKRCSESISAGRSSVYRAIETLKSQGCIEAENKLIKILDIKKLEEFTK